MAIDYTKRPAGPGAQPGSGGVSLSKVTLTKAAPSVSLTKQGANGGDMPRGFTRPPPFPGAARR